MDEIVGYTALFFGVLGALASCTMLLFFFYKRSKSLHDEPVPCVSSTGHSRAFWALLPTLFLAAVTVVVVLLGEFHESFYDLKMTAVVAVCLAIIAMVVLLVVFRENINEIFIHSPAVTTFLFLLATSIVAIENGLFWTHDAYRERSTSPIPIDILWFYGLMSVLSACLYVWSQLLTGKKRRPRSGRGNDRLIPFNLSERIPKEVDIICGSVASFDTADSSLSGDGSEVLNTVPDHEVRKLQMNARVKKLLRVKMDFRKARLSLAKSDLPRVVEESKDGDVEIAFVGLNDVAQIDADSSLDEHDVEEEKYYAYAEIDASVETIQKISRVVDQEVDRTCLSSTSTPLQTTSTESLDSKARRKQLAKSTMNWLSATKHTMDSYEESPRTVLKTPISLIRS